MSLRQIEKPYLDSLESTYKSLQDVYNTAKDYSFDLSKTEISDAILNRLRTYYRTQNDIKIFLNKRYIAAASDFFVESCLFYINLYLEASKSDLKAHSEKQLKAKRNSIRPDISIWREDEVVAIIECKTQLGWNRNNWEEEYHRRNKILQVDFPNAKSFLLVMTGVNWGGFGDHEYINNYFFCLLNEIWPFDYKGEEQIYNPIERLLSQIK